MAPIGTRVNNELLVLSLVKKIEKKKNMTLSYFGEIVMNIPLFLEIVI